MHSLELSPRLCVVCLDKKTCLLRPPLISLCLPDINRLNQPSTSTVNLAPNVTKSPDPRILIISVSPDLSTSYIPLMNSIFSAQKLVRPCLALTRVGCQLTDVSYNQKVTIDVCKLHGPDTVFLQQAAHLTGGSYLYLEHKEALLQFLIVSAVSRILINTIRSNLHAPDDFPSSASPSTVSCDSNTGQGRLSRRVFLSQEHHRCGLRLQRLPQQCVIF